MAERTFDEAVQRTRGLQVFLSLPEDQRVPPWNVNGLKDVIDASDGIKQALDEATCVESEQEPRIKQ